VCVDACVCRYGQYLGQLDSSSSHAPNLTELLRQVTGMWINQRRNVGEWSHDNQQLTRPILSKINTNYAHLAIKCTSNINGVGVARSQESVSELDLTGCGLAVSFANSPMSEVCVCMSESMSSLE